MFKTTPVNEGPTSAAGCDGPALARGLSPVVVFVPGLGLDSRSWQMVRHELRGSSAVVLLPSMGQPAPRGTDLAVERQAERLLQRLPQSGKTILVGHSASCPVVVEAATRASDVVGLVLVGPVTDPAAQTWPRMLSQWARTASHEWPSEAAVLMPQYRRTGILSMLRGIDAMRHFRTDMALSRLTMPVEVVRGESDRIASHEWSSVLRKVSNGRLTTVQGAAHMVPLTHPTAVVAAVDRLLLANRQEPPRPGL
jgi:pimeloyl-ACP methyl ester carboxylesterase